MNMRSQVASVAGLLACAGAAQAQLTENFENVAALPGAGWTIQNASTPPLNEPAWFQADTSLGVFPAFSGTPNSYAGSNFNRTGGTTGTETLSTWLVTPVLSVNNGTTITFYTRTTEDRMWADRLQVRLSTAGAGSVVPTTPTDVGTFTTLLLDINPNYVITEYPDVWTQYTITLSGLAGPTSARIAFRYFVENGGPFGLNSDYIGVDELVIGSGGGQCYGNCDNSTTPPVLNVADFTCFLQRYAAGESYANCDNSTTPPVLNVADFTCFLQRYAAGCP
jgi:hypothetical protein